MPSAGRIIATIQRDKLLELGTSQQGPIFRWMVTTNLSIEAEAKRNASGPIVDVRTGNLRAGITSDVEIRGELLVGVTRASASYAVAVHEGTRPHEIDAPTGRVLAWQPPGGPPAFATRVQHPGTKARPFLRDGMTTVIGRL
jgi:hypothetical protein